MPHVSINARVWGGLAILALVLSVHASGQSPTPTTPQATITGKTADPDDKDHLFKQCPEHALTLTITLDQNFPIGSARAELFHLKPAGASGGSGESQPATPVAVAMPQSNMLIEAHNNRPGIPGNKTVVVFPADKKMGAMLGSNELGLEHNYHLGPACGVDTTTLCTAIISVTPKTKSGRAAREPTLAYFYTYQTYPQGYKESKACAPEPSHNSKNKTEKSNSKDKTAKQRSNKPV